MKHLLTVLLSLCLFTDVIGQKSQYYENDKGEKHLCGSFSIETLKTDTTFQKWYNTNYADYSLSEKGHKWAKNLKDVKVEIYMGTWCGDSKRQVPKFVKAWDQLGLDRGQLEFVALYYGVPNKYKQGPNGEEKGKKIHRVPTFIFTRDGEEVARIVETPQNDMETDIAQIALGYPSKPNYRGANYLMTLLETNSPKEVMDSEEHLYSIYYKVSQSKELNTLGHVYLSAGKVDEAITAFYFNTRYFDFEPNVYDSYAEALAEAGRTEEAIANYEKVLLLDRSNENAWEQIKKLKEK